MSFSKTPIGFFGPGYALTSSEVKFPTASSADISVGAFTTAYATDNKLTFASHHNLKVDDKVSLTTSAADLPDPLAVSTDYFVKTATGELDVVAPSITLCSEIGGEEIVLLDDGTGTHTLHALAPLQLLTDANANATTGDWRKVALALLDLIFLKFQNTATADQSTAFTITKSVRTPSATPEDMTTTFTVVVKTRATYGDLPVE